MKYGVMTAVEEKVFDPNGNITYPEFVTIPLKLVHRMPTTGIWPANCLQMAESLGISTVFCGEDKEGYIQRANAIAMLERTVSDVEDNTLNDTLLRSRLGIRLQVLPSTLYDIVVRDGFTYIPAGRAGISVIDVHDLKNVRRIAHLDLPKPANIIKISGNYAYVFADFDIYVVDISMPANPRRVSSYVTNTGGPTRNAVIENERIYIADEWGIKIYSIKDPNALVLLCFESLLIDEFGFNSCTSDIAVRDGIAYIAFENRGIEIYDRTDINKIKLIGTYISEYVWTSNVQFSSNLAFVKLPNCSAILNIADMDNPEQIGFAMDNYSLQFNYKAGISGDIVMFPNDQNGIQIVDMSNPSKPVEIGFVDTPGIPMGVEVSDNAAYVSDGVGGICIISIPQSETDTVQEKVDTVQEENTCPSKGLKTELFAGALVEQCSLSGEKAQTTIEEERAR